MASNIDPRLNLNRTPNSKQKPWNAIVPAVVSYALAIRPMRGRLSLLGGDNLYKHHSLDHPQFCQLLSPQVSRLLSSFRPRLVKTPYNKFVCDHGCGSCWNSPHHISSHASIECSPSFLSQNCLECGNYALISRYRVSNFRNYRRRSMWVGSFKSSPECRVFSGSGGN